MDDRLSDIVKLIEDGYSLSDSGTYLLEFSPNQEQANLISALYDANAVDEITQNGRVIDSENVIVGTILTMEVVQYALQSFGYYEDVEALINANTFVVPEQFYVRTLRYLHSISDKVPIIEAYIQIVSLSNCIATLAKFIVNENDPIVYLLQDKSAVAMPLTYSVSILKGPQPDLGIIKNFVTEIGGHSERKKIYTKELIDFLNQESKEAERFEYLYKNFNAFYKKCEAAYAFFLSDFTYSKLKIELESAILDYSKNIRSIINDSQNKLIAIPAAFLVASSQLEFDKAYSLKNLLIVFSSLVFSILIEIFIRNQESSLRIFLDNVASYKMTFNIKNEDSEAKAMKSLKELLSDSFKAIDNELENQRSRLLTIRIINWGMSIFLVFVSFGLLLYNKIESVIMIFLAMIVALLAKAC